MSDTRAGPGAQEERTTGRRPLVPMFAYNLLYMAAIGLSSPGTPLYLLLVGRSGYSINVILASIALAGLAGQVFWGYISDRRSSKLALLKMGTISYVLGFLALSFISDQYMFGVTYVVFSFFGSAAYPSAMALLTSTSLARSRGASMGVFWSGASVGFAASTASAGFILQRFGGRPMFALCSLLHLASLAVVHIGLARAEVIREGGRDPAERRFTFVSSLRDIGWPFATFLLTALLFFVSDFAKNVYVPMFYAFDLGLGVVTATLLLSLTSWIEVPATVLLGALSDRIGRRRVVALSYVLCGVYMLLNFRAWGLADSVLAMSTYGIVWGAFSGASSALISELVSPQQWGMAMGLFNSSMNAASMLAPVTLGMFGEAYGRRLSFGVMGIVMFLMPLLLVKTDPNKKGRRKSPSVRLEK